MRGRALALLLLLCGCSRPKAPPGENPAPPATHAGDPQAAPTIEKPRAGVPALSQDAFVDITAESGVRFKHFNDASARRYLPETMGAGAAFLDYDNDGRPDLYLVNGAPLAGDRSRARSGSLYRNLDGTTSRT